MGHDATLLTISQYDAERDHYLDSASLGISHNTRGQTPLHLAASQSHISVVRLLTTKCPECINRPDFGGMTPLMLASRGHPDSDYVAPPYAISAAAQANGAPIQAAANAAGLITSRMGHGLLSSSRTPAHYANNSSSISQIPASNFATVEHFLKLPSITSLSPPLSVLVTSRDSSGNTALHHASASGNLKAIRALIVAGSDPLAKNNSGWQPEAYSVSVQAEVYYKGLVTEWRERTARGHSAERTSRTASRSPDKGRNDGERASNEISRMQRTRRRQGTIGTPSPTTQGPSPSANISGMGKGGLRLVMPDDDDGADQVESEGLRHSHPTPMFSQDAANHRKRGMTDTSHSSSTTSGSGSPELSNTSSRQSEEDDNDDNDDDLSDSEEDDGTATARNSVYQLDEMDAPPPRGSSSHNTAMTSPSQQHQQIYDGSGFVGRLGQLPRIRRPSRLDSLSTEASSISAVTPTGTTDLWK